MIDRRIVNAAKCLRKRGFDVRVDPLAGVYVMVARPDPGYVPSPSMPRIRRPTPVRARTITFANKNLRLTPPDRSKSPAPSTTSAGAGEISQVRE